MTRLLAYLGEALASLWRNRVRSILTMLGMIIGSASIIAVFGISRAATSGIAATFTSFGQFPVFVFADPTQNFPAEAAIKYRDVATVATALGDSTTSVQPTWTRTYPVSVGSIRDYISITSDGDNDTAKLSDGRAITTSELNSGARVCMLTQDVATKFFGDASPIGDYVRINGGAYEVVGVYSAVSGFLSGAASATIAVPFTTYYNELTNVESDAIMVFPTDPLQADAVGKATVAALQRIHGTRSKYTVQNSADFIKNFETVINSVGIGLAAIGGVALVVAGIGIMNIMLVSVTERTREIGIRKAIGANRHDIVLQFLMESLLLSIFGGAIGTGIGLVSTIGAAAILSKTLGEMLIPYLAIVSIAVIFSLLVGTVFGTYPAVRASLMDPIEALRS